MSNALFPTLPGLAWNVKRRPIWQTRLQTAISGKETRSADWTYPRWHWELKYDLLRDDATAELRTLLGFFLQRQGRYDSFLFQDPDDNAVAFQTLGTGDGTTASFQLIRALGGFIEPFRDINGTPTIFLSGNPLPLNSGYAIASGGIVSFATPPAAGTPIAASFGYYFRVRFSVDFAEFEKFAQALWQLQRIELVSLK